MNNKLLIALTLLISACEVAVAPSETQAVTTKETVPETAPIASLLPDFGIGSPVRLNPTTGVNVFASLPVGKFCLPRHKQTDYVVTYVNHVRTYVRGSENVIYFDYSPGIQYANWVLIQFGYETKNYSPYRNEYVEMVRDYLSMQNMIEDVDYELRVESLPIGGEGINIQPLKGYKFHGECRDHYLLD